MSKVQKNETKNEKMTAQTPECTKIHFLEMAHTNFLRWIRFRCQN